MRICLVLAAMAAFVAPQLAQAAIVKVEFTVDVVTKHNGDYSRLPFDPLPGRRAVLTFDNTPNATSFYNYQDGDNEIRNAVTDYGNGNSVQIASAIPFVADMMPNHGDTDHSQYLTVQSTTRPPYPVPGPIMMRHIQARVFDFTWVDNDDGSRTQWSRDLAIGQYDVSPDPEQRLLSDPSFTAPDLLAYYRDVQAGAHGFYYQETLSTYLAASNSYSSVFWYGFARVTAVTVEDASEVPEPAMPFLMAAAAIAMLRTRRMVKS